MSDPIRKYDLYSQEAKAHIYETFARIRQEDPLLHQLGLNGESKLWFASRYEDVVAILRNDQQFVRDARNALDPEAFGEQTVTQQMMSNHMLNKDWGDHRRLRNLVSKAFTPKIVRQLRPRVVELTNELLDEVIDRGEMDLIADFVFHLPTIVIAELLGVPATDRDKFKIWSNAAIMPAMDEASQADAQRHMQEFLAYLQQCFAERRQNPGNDLTSALIHAEESGDRLSESELFSMLFLLIIAGHETTVSLIGNAMLALWEHPEQFALLKENPDLIGTAVEEFLRYDAPVERAFVRWAAEDVELNGQHFPKGTPIIPIIASANRDEAVYENGEQLDITRRTNPHLGFGHGVHYCVGAPLARMEAEIALNALLARMPDIHMTIPRSELRWRMIPGFHSVENIPVAWTPVPA